MSRAAYLRLCLLTSLRKRWGWVLLTALLSGVAGLVFGSPGLGLVAAVAALLLHAVCIAAGSYKRHRDGYLPLLPARRTELGSARLAELPPK
ncbi:hypothetical protein GCM10022631_23360 [Deinococcus rubellus]|uniref:hypothetical protein n=1 Tax=Deinococcus rubellus TaxID=1889240 RepID=UPI0031EC8857